MTSTTLSPRPAFTDDFKLTDARCVRWFLEGLQALRLFEKTASKAALEDAERLLDQCVQHYPKDLLPRFYWGVAKSVLGDMNQDPAIQCFSEFTKSANFEIRAAASYNLALSYLETYDKRKMRTAKGILTSLLEDLKAHGAPVGQWPLIRTILGWFGGKKPRIESVYFLAHEARCYLQADLILWRHEWKANVARHKKLADRFSKNLKKRARRLRHNARYLGDEGPEIWAWHWNNVGLVEESRAALQLREAPLTSPGAVSTEAAASGKRALDAYKRALESDPLWASAKSNIGRLRWEIFGDIEGAIRAFEDALDGSEDTEYNHYNLGILRAMLGEQEKAIEHFKQAPEMLKRRKQPATWAGALKMLAYELKKIGRAPELIKTLEAVVREDPGDTDARNELDALRKPQGQAGGAGGLVGA